MGRPDKLEPHRAERIIELLRAGNFRETAARASGVHDATFHRWMERGEKAQEDFDRQLREHPDREPTIEASEQKYRDFRKACIEAETHAELDMVARFQLGAVKDWKAAENFLSRRYKDRWAKTTNIEVGGEVTHLHQLDSTRKVLAQRIEAIALEGQAEDDDPTADAEALADAE